MASHGLPSTRPPTFSHVICLSQSEESTASHAHGLPRLAGRESPILRPIGLLRPRIGLHRPVCVRGRLAVGGHVRDLSESPRWEAEHGLSPQSHVICLRVRSERSCGRPIDLSHTPGEAMRLAVKSVRWPEDRTASPGVRERPIGLPHGLSLRPHRSDSHY